MLNQLLTVTFFTFALTASAYTPPDAWECDSPGTQGFFISDEPVTFKDAVGACAQHNGVLADISNKNFLLATDIILNCVGQNQNAWIRTWDYNPVNPQIRDCLAVYVGFTGPGGGIDLECGGTRYALCADRNSLRSPFENYTTLPRAPLSNFTSGTTLTTPAPVYYTQSSPNAGGSFQYLTNYAGSFNQSASSSHSVNASVASTRSVASTSSSTSI